MKDPELEVVIGFLNGNLDISKISKTYIVVITKVKNPRVISEFRSISLCSVVY